ncbi:mid1-interacting protein 1-like protein [Euroglyphus maynei]|uniref:Mid1-interacting protein 1-like protein n=1 Tax=Euroglyphus maynei TaxID=6958 RepID=A0A1Y3B2Y4_EURMA|nr:mid1-interacting protein 1-like protein [Euroglyphus maynei]
MERFVRSMNNMDATVLVPSKLRDMDNIGMKTDRHLIPSTFSNQLTNQTNELHNFFIMLNDVKKELLWGCSTSSTLSMAQSSSSSSPTSSSSSSSSTSHEFVYQNHRRNSTINTPIFNRSISVQSSMVNNQQQSLMNNHHNHNSSIMAIKHSRQSSQEDCLLGGSIGSSVSSSSDTESDADSMLTDSIEDSTSNLFVSFRHHLQGLHSILNQLADSADYLSIRYQEEIDGI